VTLSQRLLLGSLVLVSLLVVAIVALSGSRLERRLVEAHGGSVRATSTVGAGTEVAVVFPDS
jgi:hypothetical protein